MKDKTILVVEDNPVTSKMVRVTLEGYGSHVIEAPTGREALDALALFRPQLVILDLMLPDADGTELVALMRETDEGQTIPILAFSGLRSRMDQARLMRAAFTDYLFKPVEPSRLVEIVSAHLRTPSAPADALANGELLLLVDDDQAQCRLNAIQLSELGFEVQTASDASSALALARTRRPQIVVTDLIMPGMTGLELCRALRQDETLSAIPVIVASSTFSHIDQHDRAMATHMGANAFVRRTPTLDEVIDAIRRHLHARGTPPSADADATGQEYTRRLIRQLEHQGRLQTVLMRRAAVDSALLSVLTGTAQVLAQKASLSVVIRDSLARVLDACGLAAAAVCLKTAGGQMEPVAVIGNAPVDPRALTQFFSNSRCRDQLSGENAAVRMRLDELASAADIPCSGDAQRHWLVIAPIMVNGVLNGYMVTCSPDEALMEDWADSAQAVANQIGMAVALSRSVDDLVASERKIRERERRFLELADNTSEVFYILDTRSRETLYVNPAYEQCFGRTRQSLYDNPASFADAVHPDDRAALLAGLQRLERGESQPELEYRVILPNGLVRWIRDRAQPIQNEQGEVYRINGIARDVTDRHESEEALRESLERYRLLTDASFDAISITVDGVIQEVNRGFLSTFGYESENEVVGRPVIEFLAEESIAEARERMTRNMPGTYDLVAKHKDGRKLYLDVTGRPQMVGGKPGRITALRDVTERHTLQAQVQQSQKMEAVGRLAGGVAHDFNNLLTVIGGHTEMLLDDFAAGDPRRASLERIGEASHSAAALTRQLLAFSRRQVIEPITLVLNDAVLRSKKLLTKVIGEDIEITTRLTEASCLVRLDPGQLDQVIINLAVNSRDAMPTGGRLMLETAVVELRENFAGARWPETPGTYAMLAVSDTGVGMDAHVRERIFEPFFTTKEAGKGTGLGLATVYGIVKQSGGSIDVYSEPGVGTTFKIYFPLDAAGSAVGTATEKPETPRGTETILLVEDSQGVREIARRVLQRQGYVVVEAHGGAEALEIAKRDDLAIDLLLTDVVMPGMSGRVLSEQFRTMRPQARTLYMSGYTDDAVVRHGVLNASQPYIQKPFTPHALGSKIREVLDA